ncbi:molybdopterin molybdotransferase MoeA [Pseudalkalibacillus salsuginis]|uniref:molybdopterin molybdotransferase MoeA n=1 Tax=Pseudalkalibacillus salsuginis TaxID=2910972 RepID=UPI001F1825F4|nr:gephyrin-like molybdotransferase Glp [Pseudalkalibacillus salsuginis]MCF6409225.1 molybdopterin molybdotransferase MoeA [Pseudalkalibacillus salsuginis]
MVVERRKPIQIGEGVKRVMAHPLKSKSEELNIEETLDRFLAEPIIADHDVPPFDRSPYDGFALRAGDTKHASAETPVQLEVIEEIGAGQVATSQLRQGQAIRIMTGASIPDGADAVSMFEVVKEYEKDMKQMIEVGRKFTPGQNIARQGEDTERGTVLIKEGTRITPGVTALLATFGYKTVNVYQKPKIGIYATGTELLNIDEPLQPGKIRNSNAYMISAQIRKMGGDPLYLGKLADDFEACFRAISTALEDVDALVTTGGVSVGDYDYLPAIYEKLGATTLFNKIAMRPGSVTTVAEYEGKLLFGLSGNPSACFVGGELFVRPFIKQAVKSMPYLAKMKAVLAKDFPKPNPFTRLVRGKIEYAAEGVRVAPTGLDKSSSVTSIAKADIFIVLPGGTRGFRTGDEVEVLLFNNESDQNPWEK